MNLAGPFDSDKKSKKGIPSTSTRNKISWVFGHEAKFTKYVKTFKALVQKLYTLVSQDMDNKTATSNPTKPSTRLGMSTFIIFAVVKLIQYR